MNTNVPILEIKNLQACINENKILKSLNRPQSAATNRGKPHDSRQRR